MILTISLLFLIGFGNAHIVLVLQGTLTEFVFQQRCRINTLHIQNPNIAALCRYHLGRWNFH